MKVFDNKLTHTKCPNCKKYGIGFFRGIGYRSTYTETCSYCGEKFKVNPALAAILKIGIPVFFSMVFLIIKSYVIDLPNWLLLIFILVLYFLALRLCPMEENDSNLSDDE